jgi:signal transduction histidine kinase
MKEPGYRYSQGGKYDFILPTLLVLWGCAFLVFTGLGVAYRYNLSIPLYILLIAGWVILLGMGIFMIVTAQKARDYSKLLSHRLDTMEALQRISLDLVSVLDLDTVLTSIAQRTAKYLDAGICYLTLFDLDKMLLRVTAQSDGLPNLIGLEVEMTEGVAGAVYASGEPRIINDYLHWERHIPDITNYDAFLGVPLKWQGKIIGVLSIGDYAKRRIFTDADAWLLGPFADLASIAINNAQIYGEKKRLSEELSRRDEIKSKLLAETENELVQKAFQLQGLLNRMTQLQEAERARIARDMHDSITQLILGGVYATQAAIQGLEKNNLSSAKENMEMVRLFLRQVEGEIRETIRNLRPVVLDAKGIAPAIQQYSDDFSDLTGIGCTFVQTGEPFDLSDEKELAVYRIVQEAMRNILTHANARQVTVRADYSPDRLQVCVADDGLGFDISAISEKPTDHFGLIGMRERAESIGASIKIITHPGEGTQVLLDVPIAPPSEPIEAERYG